MKYIASGKAKDIFEKPNGDLIFEFTTKFEAVDRPVGKEAGLIFADFKVEYDRNPNNEIILADEVGTPDGNWFWDNAEYEKGNIGSLDKDVFRKDSGDLNAAYIELFERMHQSCWI